MSQVVDDDEAHSVRQLTVALQKYPHLIDKPLPGEDGRTYMHIAAYHGHTKNIEMLMNRGCVSIDTMTEKGETPLLLAARMDRISTVRILVRLGSKAINTPSRLRTPLSEAVCYANMKMAKTLIEMGSTTLNLPDHQEETLMTNILQNNKSFLIEPLIRLGFTNINAPDSHGSTPLSYAASVGDETAVELLIHFGSTAIDTPNNNMFTPLHRAQLNGRKSCARMLKLLGADCSTLIRKSQYLLEPIDEEESYELRARVYFRRSLSARLLLETKKQR